MNTEQGPNRDEVHAIYEQGEEAVHALVMGLIEAHQREIAKLERRIAALEGQVGKDSQPSATRRCSTEPNAKLAATRPTCAFRSAS